MEINEGSIDLMFAMAAIKPSDRREAALAWLIEHPGTVSDLVAGGMLRLESAPPNTHEILSKIGGIVPASEFLSALAEADKSIPRGTIPSETIYLGDHQYWQRTKEGDYPVSTFSVEIEKETLINDGISSRRVFGGLIKIMGQSDAIKFSSVKSDIFCTGAEFDSWILSTGGSQCRYATKFKALSNAILGGSHPIREEASEQQGFCVSTAAYHCQSSTIDAAGVGWPQRNIQLCGAGVADGIDMTIISDSEMAEVSEHIYSKLMNIHAPIVTGCLAGYCAMAPAVQAIEMKFPAANLRSGLWIRGESGDGKSYAARMFQCLFGSKFSADRAIIGWSSTPYSIQRTGHYFAGAACLVDDFKLAYFQSKQRYSQMIEVLQNIGDGRGRSRLTASSDAAKSYSFLGTFITTGEDLPAGEASIASRFLFLDAPHIPLTKERTAIGRECHKMSQKYSGFMARFISWMIGLQNWPDCIMDEFDRKTDEMLLIAGDRANSIRLARHAAFAVIGNSLWNRFFLHLGKKNSMRLAGEFELLMVNRISGGMGLVEESRAGTIFIDVLRELVISGCIRILSEKSTMLDHGEIIGYDERDDVLWLLPKICHKVVSEFTRKSGHELSFSPAAIRDQLISDGVIIPYRDGSPTTSVYCVNGQARVYVVKKNKFFIEDK